MCDPCFHVETRTQPAVAICAPLIIVLQDCGLNRKSLHDNVIVTHCYHVVLSAHYVILQVCAEITRIAVPTHVIAHFLK